jgi:hypothetical protein
MTKRRIGFLAALSLTLVAMATAFASQARPVESHGRSAAHGKYVRPAATYFQHGPGGCDGGSDATYDGSDL